MSDPGPPHPGRSRRTRRVGRRSGPPSSLDPGRAQGSRPGCEPCLALARGAQPCAAAAGREHGIEVRRAKDLSVN